MRLLPFFAQANQPPDTFTQSPIQFFNSHNFWASFQSPNSQTIRRRISIFSESTYGEEGEATRASAWIEK